MRRIRRKNVYNYLIVVMTVLLALSLAATITLAAFRANKSGAVVLSFANGLTMTLASVGTSGRFHVVTSNTEAATFTYEPMDNLTSAGTLDGIKATISQDAYIAYRIELVERTSGSNVVPLGAWSIKSQYSAYFEPSSSAPLNGWMATLFTTDTVFHPQVDANAVNVIHCNSGSTALDHSQEIVLFDYLRIRGMPDVSIITDLQGRTFEFIMTIAARTDQVPDL